MAPRDKGAKIAAQKHRSGTKVRPRSKPKAEVKSERAKKTYGRDEHRHAPDAEKPVSRKKLERETPGVDEDLSYGAGVRAHSDVWHGTAHLADVQARRHGPRSEARSARTRR